MRSSSLSVLVLGVAAQLGGCKKKAPAIEDVAAAAVSARVNIADAKEAARRRKWAMPSGPALPVEPGSGLGAIRARRGLAPTVQAGDAGVAPTARGAA